MIQRTKFVILLVLALFGTNCATTATTQNYNKILDSWVGHDMDELVRSWGYPTKAFQAPNGNTVYAYERAVTGVTPTRATPTLTHVTVYGNTAIATTTGGQTVGGHPYSFWCNTFLEVNSSNRVIFWRWEGNNCKAR